MESPFRRRKSTGSEDEPKNSSLRRTPRQDYYVNNSPVQARSAARRESSLIQENDTTKSAIR
jgi:hypothetical protein